MVGDAEDLKKDEMVEGRMTFRRLPIRSPTADESWFSGLENRFQCQGLEMETGMKFAWSGIPFHVRNDVPSGIAVMNLEIHSDVDGHFVSPENRIHIEPGSDSPWHSLSRGFDRAC